MNKITDKLLSWASILDEQTKQQAIQTSEMPFIYKYVALMPDAHLGMGSTVGSVIPTIGAVMPASVGVDIGCGMAALKSQFTKKDLEVKPLSELRHSIERSIPVSAGGYNKTFTPSAKKRIDELEKLAGSKDVLKFYESLTKTSWKFQLGSLGSGNHFIEIVADEEGNVWIFLHSGSRGIGNKIGDHYIKLAQAICRKASISLPNRDLAYLVEDTPAFNDYIRDLHWAQQFALLNREEMLDRIIKDISHFMGEEVRVLERINTHHNYTQKEHHMGADVWLTRKGAIQAEEGKLGLIPGSMGAASYVVVGKGNEAAFNSAPHGAGRIFSRTEAKRRFTLDDLKSQMTGIEFNPSADFIDEIPTTYKPIDLIMEDAKDLVEIKHTFRQIINVKGK